MYTVVVADDEVEVRSGIIRRINWEEIGFQVIGEADNGIDALELVEKMEPDLLLTDIRMPFLSGIELARQVREVRPTVSIAFLSGFDEFAYAQQAIQYNIISYMLKPISSKELTEKLREIKGILDKKFQDFASRTLAKEELVRSEFLLSLLLNGYTENENQELIKHAIECGFLREDNPEAFNYVVLVVEVLDGDNQNCTIREHINAVDTILKKYVRYVSGYFKGQIVSLVAATPASLHKYLHILAEEIVLSTERILKSNCMIGISRKTGEINDCHSCYLEAVKAIAYMGQSDGKIHYIEDAKRKTNSELLCKKAMEIIEEQYSDPDLSLVNVSEMIAVSPNYLSALIRKYTGRTFVENLTEKRMAHAKELLAYSDMKVHEVARKCGYWDQHYFSYCFKKKMGVSPNICRRNYEEK